MAQERKSVQKVKPTPKRGIAVSHEEDHPAGLWMDPEAFGPMNGRVSTSLRRETFEVSNRYLELAAMVSDANQPKKRPRSESKKAQITANEASRVK